MKDLLNSQFNILVLLQSSFLLNFGFSVDCNVKEGLEIA